MGHLLMQDGAASPPSGCSQRLFPWEREVFSLFVNHLQKNEALTAPFAGRVMPCCCYWLPETHTH